MFVKRIKMAIVEDGERLRTKPLFLRKASNISDGDFRQSVSDQTDVMVERLERGTGA